MVKDSNEKSKPLQLDNDLSPLSKTELQKLFEDFREKVLEQKDVELEQAKPLPLNPEE